MPTFNDKPVYTLTQVGQNIQSMIERTYKYPYYIQAEMVKLNYYPRSGHCFPELVEKESGYVKAQMRAVIWNSNFARINDNFEKITGEPLKDGLTILCLATIQYSPQYGLSLFIQDIEPSFTLGKMAQERLKTIARLKAEGVFEANRKLKMPLLPQRIAVISIETSKGYSDFMITLQSDRHGYHFYTELFPSLLQGEKAVTTMCEQLSHIEKRAAEFDCVAIIRGGGGDVGLNCYDQYELAHRVATFPLPVLSGIGHSTNETITEKVSFANKITPTEVAYFLINSFVDFENNVNALQRDMAKATARMLEREYSALSHIEANFKLAAHQRLDTEKHALDKFQSHVFIYSKQKLSSSATLLSHWEEKLKLLDPSNILRRGFSITYHDGKPVMDASALTPGDELETRFFTGTRNSVVT